MTIVIEPPAQPSATTMTATLSAQENAIESGKLVMHGTVTDRALRMYEAIRAYGPPRVTLDRAVLFTESLKETVGQPLVLRWAKALIYGTGIMSAKDTERLPILEAESAKQKAETH